MFLWLQEMVKWPRILLQESGFVAKIQDRPLGMYDTFKWWLLVSLLLHLAGKAKPQLIIVVVPEKTSEAPKIKQVPKDN